VVRAKSGCLHGHNSGAETARELFKHSKDSAGLLVANEKTIFGFQIFCE